MHVILRVTSINGLRFDITVLTLTVRPLKRFYPLDVDLISFKVTPPKTETQKYLKIDGSIQQKFIPFLNISLEILLCYQEISICVRSCVCSRCECVFKILPFNKVIYGGCH